MQRREPRVGAVRTADERSARGSPKGRLATKLDAKRTRELVAVGAGFDLDAAAVYARQQPGG
jgi:hypothetical protein